MLIAPPSLQWGIIGHILLILMFYFNCRFSFSMHCGIVYLGWYHIRKAAKQRGGYMEKRFEDMQGRSLVTSANGRIIYQPISSLNNKQESNSELLWKDALIEKGFQLPTQQADFKDLFILIKKAFG